jgi:hypothetical protein
VASISTRLSDELGDQPELQEILGLNVGQELAEPQVGLALDLGAEA